MKYKKWSTANNSASQPINQKISFLTKFLKGFFWFLVIGLIIIIGISSYYLYYYFSVEREIDFSLNAPEKVFIGQPFDLEFYFFNGSGKTLSNVNFVLYLPEGVSFLNDPEKRLIFKKINNVLPAEGIKEKLPLIISKSGIKNFKAKISYSAGLKADFEKIKTTEVAADEPIISLTIDAPEKVLNNEEFDFKVKYANLSEKKLSGVSISFAFPTGFKLKNSEPKIDRDYIYFDKLLPFESGEIKIKGSIIGQEGAFFEIKTQIKTFFSGHQFVINEKTASLNISLSPLSLKILLDNVFSDFVFPGDKLKYKLIYKNNTNSVIRDAVIKLKLKGEMFDFLELETDGEFSSRKNIITFSPAQIPELRLINPNESGEINFSIKVKKDYPISSRSDKNFVLKIEGEIVSLSVPKGLAVKKLVGLAKIETKVAGYLEVFTDVYYRDPYFLKINTGPLPFKVDQTTTLTVHWKIKNYATDVENILVRAFVPSGVRFLKTIKLDNDSELKYNENTKEIVLRIKNIPATKGVISKPKEIVFQIEVVPNILQAGQIIEILGSTSITGFDKFSQTELSNIFPAVYSKDLKDSGFSEEKGKVIQ